MVCSRVGWLPATWISKWETSISLFLPLRESRMACHLFSQREPIRSVKLRIVLAIGLCALVFPSRTSAAADSTGAQTGHPMPRILILDPVVPGGEPDEGRRFAGWLTAALGKDGRTIPYRPTTETRRDSGLAVSCGDTACARRWRQKMSLEQIWFGSLEEDADSVRLRIEALGAQDSVIARSERKEAKFIADRRSPMARGGV